MLSHRTTHKDEELAYERMLVAFGDWPGVEAAPIDALTHEIRTTRWPGVQAPRIQEALRCIQAQTGGAYSLGFLAEMPTDAAMRWLTALPGVGLKTASLLLLFNFNRTYAKRTAKLQLRPQPRAKLELRGTLLPFCVNPI
ncbi:MAG: hypothetical protein H7330_12225 [Hymenobacteraceae bacterium]|nr:hypothetical protein [Hymenobacteraceae bacterium]